MKKFQALIESLLLFGILYLIYEIMYFSYMFIIRRGILEGWQWVDVKDYQGLGVDEMSLRYMIDHPIEYTVLSWVLIMAIIVLIILATKGGLLKDMSIRWFGLGGFLASIIVGLGLVLAMNGVVILFGEATDYTISYIPDQIFDAYDIGYLILTAGMITPICEELFFRGLVQGRLMKGMTSFFSVLIAAIIFSVSHLNLIQSLFVLPVGILCGVLVVQTGSIFSAIWLHMVYNVLNIYLAKMPLFQYNSLQLLVMVVFGFALMAFGLNLIGQPTTHQPYTE